MTSQHLYYAIVSDTFPSALGWFQDKYEDKIKEFIISHRMFIMKDGSRYVIITRPEQAQRYEFVGIEICPTYTDLLSEVKKRIR
jgi:hypothetical protein